MRLDGIDGSNLWGFMAALGTLSLLDDHARVEKEPRPRLSFGSDFVAELATDLPATSIARVALAGIQASRSFYADDLANVQKPTDLTCEALAKLAITASRSQLGAVAGLACCVGERTIESSLCAANGAGHQNLVVSIRDILNLVQVEHLEAALFTPWRRQYDIPEQVRKDLGLGNRKPTLRLDPADERLYALRLSDPTGADDFRTELGAQALAIPTFALLPVLPLRRPVSIASKRVGNRVYFSWTLWGLPATLASVRSLLATGPASADTARARGAVAAFQVARVSGGKGKLSFTPTEGLW